MNVMHTFFIDDSGTKEYSDKSINLFCYGGIIVNNDDIALYTEKLRQLKRDYFNGDTPEIKSHWLRRPEKRLKLYLNPYEMKERALNSYTEKLFELMRTFNVHAIGVVVDKEGILQKYNKAHFYPSSICYEFLLQRIANYCTQYRVSKVSIIMDDMSGKTPKGKEWKKLLVDQHKNLRQGKSQFYRKWSQRSKMNYDSIDKNLKFVDSKDSELTQIADICAYNIMRQARDRWNNFDDEPLYKGYKWIMPIMHKNPSNEKIKKLNLELYVSLEKRG